MNNRWVDGEADKMVEEFGPAWGEAMALRAYSARLLGADPGLVLHGGGNTSVKGMKKNLLGEGVPGLFVKGSGHDLKTIWPEGHVGLDLDPLLKLEALDALDDAKMVNQLRTRLFEAEAPTPSIEALLHAFITELYIDHTHADAILALTNREGGDAAVKDALGETVVVVPYVIPGFQLAKAAATAYKANPGIEGMVLMHHGLITWGKSARESYDKHIDLVSRAEAWLAAKGAPLTAGKSASVTVEAAQAAYRTLAPMLRGALASPQRGRNRQPWERFVLKPLITPEVLALLETEGAQELLVSPTLTSDHLIRTKALPLWFDAGEEEGMRERFEEALRHYIEAYDAYYEARADIHNVRALHRFDARPRVILIPGVGAVCAGSNDADAEISRDITAQTLAAKAVISGTGGTYRGLSDDHLFAMEYLPMQLAKLAGAEAAPLGRETVLVTGAAGAIGAGVCRHLLEEGCHLAASDLPGERLDSLVAQLAADFPGRVIGVGMDVSNPEAVVEGFGQVIDAWGGLDQLVINAGLAYVSTLAEMDFARYQTLQAVNVEGTLHLLAEAGRHFKTQGSGGDVVLISTKNVFCPGAGFGAYSATKAASHQLARIASLEMAGIDVRVNMVAPDAVFSDGARKSGLWAEVGPDRMKARGLTEDGLEEYYRNRNLLKAKVTADHVANATLYFLTRQSPTTGATIPVDGGLPDATPR